MSEEIPQYKDRYNNVLGQGDFILFAGKEVLFAGVVVSLFYSHTYKKYTGVKVTYENGYGSMVNTNLYAGKGDRISAYKLGAEYKLSEKLIDLSSACIGERWDNKPAKPQADGTKILSMLTRGGTQAKGWVKNEKHRNERWLNQKGRYGYYSPNKLPNKLYLETTTEKGKLSFIFTAIDNAIHCEIKLDGKLRTVEEFICELDLSPTEILRRIDVIENTMKQCLPIKRYE